MIFEIPTVRSLYLLLTQRRINKRRQIVSEALLEFNALSVTYHGRVMIQNVINDPDNGLDATLRRMYAVMVLNAPLKEWAQWN